MWTQRLPQRAGIYCRLSYAPDGSLEKVERQEADCRALAGRLGWGLSEAHIFPDNSRSAWQRTRSRPQWDRMLRSIEAEEIDGIIVYHGDRLIRQPYDLETLIGISESRGMRIASPSGTRDLDSPDDRFILRIEAAQACRESDNISRRVKRALDARLERGLTQNGGRRAFGYGVQIGTRTTVVDGVEAQVPVYDMGQQVAEEAQVLLEAGERLLAGQPQAGVVRWMDTRCTTTEGNPWTAKTLRNLCLAPRAAGLIERNGELYEAAWDGIFPREMWESLRRYYVTGAELQPHPGRERRYLLSGVGGAQCCFDGSWLATKPTGGRNRKGSRIYYCPTCRRIGRNITHTDAYVSGRALRLLNSPELMAELAARAEDPGRADELAALERRRDTVRQQIESLADHPDVDAGLALVGLASLEKKIKELRAQLGASAEHRLLGRMVGITPEQWDATPIDIRATTVRILFGVILLPTTRRGPGFDTDAIRVVRARTTTPPPPAGQ
ncbi:recombinase family protein [Streptomyces sp. DH8]|uniref:recombinase family protein n=1 Tax=Streptomyces sp. DH8 TaxID=2857008 RepID=UPI001E515ED2|nr:recombinase family protein [Streptomyces sp. DH8]